MLKIKDSVDLKELEKFGYKKIANCYYKEVMKDNNSKCWTYYESIDINIETREIYSELYNDQMNMTWISYDIRKDHYIQDLIKADMVEKV